MAGCCGVADGCWGTPPLAGHDPHDWWVNGNEASGGGEDAVAGDAVPAAGGACQRGRGAPLLQQAS